MSEDKVTKPTDKPTTKAADPKLPPAGAARREELARRADQLAKEVDELSATDEVGAIDPSKLHKKEREIQQHMERDRDTGVVDYHISNLNTDEFDYYLAAFRYPAAAPWREVHAAKLRGFHPVREGIDPEGENTLDCTAEGYRYLGDTILMKRPRWVADQEEAEERIRTATRHGAFGDELEALADQYRAKGVDLVIRKDIGDAETQSTIKQGMAKQLGKQMFNQQLRTGTSPGANAAKR